MTETRSTELIDRSRYRRAVEAVIWGMPAVTFELMRSAMSPTGANRFVSWSDPTDWRIQTLTPGPDQVSYVAFIDLRESGPMVLEVPPADLRHTLNGTIFTAWHVPLADVGPAGVEQGEGARFLLLPPDFAGHVPPGYLVLRSETQQNYALLHAAVGADTPPDRQAALEHCRQVAMYPLARAEQRPTAPTSDLTGLLIDATVPYDLRFFHALHRIVQSEAWLERDRPFAEMLAAIGIVKGEPFAPEPHLAELLVDAACEARAFLAEELAATSPFYETGHWIYPATAAFAEAQQRGYQGHETYPYTARGVVHHLAAGGPRRIGPDQFQLLTTCDSAGVPFDSAGHYRLRVPAAVPVTRSWSVAVYDAETHAFIRGNDQLSVSSLSPELTVGPDGSVEVFVGPAADSSGEVNWIATGASRRFELMFRFHGSQPAVLDRSWRLPDVERVR